MKILYCALFVLVLVSCKRNTETKNISVECIPVYLNDNGNDRMSDFIHKIEVISLQTDTNCLISTYSKMDYCEELEMYIIMDKELIVSLFSKDGKFIANSKSVMGDGPEEYRTAVDVIYNPYSKSIEILNPYGTIYRYDTSFRFIEKMSLDRNSQIFVRFTPLDRNQYILTPVVTGFKDAAMYFCDYDKNIIGLPISYEEDCFASVSMNYNPFFKIDGDLFFSPLFFNYMFYKVNPYTQTILPIMQLDFKDKAVHKNDLVKQFGTTSKESINREDVERNFKVLSNTNDYLRNSNIPIPIIKFFNDKYVYLFILQKDETISYIYDRHKKQSYMQTAKSEVRLNFCFYIDDNILVSMVQPYEIENYVDEKLMDKKYLNVIKNIEEDNNPIIIKYYLQ